MKYIAVCFLLMGMFSINGISQVSTGELQQSLNGTWAFKTDPDNTGEHHKWFDENSPSSGWDSMPVPGNWDLRNEYSHYAGKAWYRKTFSTPASWQTKWVRLLFEAVYHDSKVWLNGHLLGTNNSGFLPFEFDVNKWLNTGKPNTLVVCADNSFKRGAIWNWGGIRRPVTLVASSNVRIQRQHISSVIDLQKKSAKLTVLVMLKNEGSKAVSLQGEVLITGEKGFQKKLPFNALVEEGKTTTASVECIISKQQLHLWNMDDPFLYLSSVMVKNEQGLLDESQERFGLRKVEVDNANYTFKLNGESVRVMGLNLVPDDRTTGNTLPAWRYKEDIDLMKSMGANLARLSHLPLPEEVLNYLDEKGIMIFAEIPLWGFDQLVDKNNPIPKEWLSRLITNQFNHPSIIGWSVGNEIGQVPGAMEYVESAIQFVITLDTTRLAVMVSHTADRGEEDPIKYSELGLVNKYGTYIGALADKMHGFHKDKLLFYTEYGYGQLQEHLDADVNAKAMVDSIRFKPFLIGGSLWTFNDYRSAYPGTKEFSENRPWGIVDVFRQKKQAWYSFRKEYNPVRTLAVSNLINAASASATINIQPRLLLDLPAYTLRHYNLAWKVYGVNGAIQKGGLIPLPEIKPGDAAMQFPISWQMPVEAARLEVSLLSPLNYAVADTVIFLRKPVTPVILSATGVRSQMNELRSNSGSIRVVFEKNETATYYKLKYGKGGLTKETTPTRNNFLMIPDLAFGDTYQVSLVAINSFGESDPGTITEVKIETGYAAPLVAYTEAANEGFYAGYPNDQEDYLLQLQYTNIKGDYSAAPMIQTTNKGVLFVPGLQNGKTYYYRIRRWKHNTYITPWSEETMVMPDGGMAPSKPVLSGVLRNGSNALVCFAPLHKATGYLIEYGISGSSQWQSIQVDAAQISHYQITGLLPSKQYEFRMAVLNQYGQSGWSESVTQ